MLIDEEQDIRDVLRIEDEAILAVENPVPPDEPEDIGALIERLTNGEPETVQQG